MPASHSEGKDPHVTAFGSASFDDDLTLSTIMRDQERIGGLNFFSGQWIVKWKDAQK